MTSLLNRQPSPYSFLGGFKVTFLGALSTLMRMRIWHFALRHRVAGWPAIHARCCNFYEPVSTSYSKLSSQMTRVDQTLARSMEMWLRHQWNVDRSGDELKKLWRYVSDSLDSKGRVSVDGDLELQRDLLSNRLCEWAWKLRGEGGGGGGHHFACA